MTNDDNSKYDNRLVRIATPPCCVCGKESIIRAPEVEFRNWQKAQGDMNDPNRLIQVGMSSLTADEREMLITGTHPDCWDSLMTDDEDED